MKKNKKKAPRKLKRRVLFGILFLVLIVVLWAVYFFLSLPEVEHLRTHNPITTSMMELRKTQALQKGTTLHIHHRWAPFGEIPLLLKHTVRIAEDANFYHHEGIDYYELKEAVKRNLRDGKKTRGGSTITQQLAKNLFLSTEKSYYRKFKEFFIAKKLEHHLSKDRIFHIYLNIIEWGHGIFGIGAASRFYFGKPPQQLSLEQIVRLVAVVPRPLKVTPLSNSRYMKWKAGLLLDRLKAYGHIDPQQHRRAKAAFR